MTDQEKEIISSLATLKEQGRWQAQEISEMKNDIKGLLADKWTRFGSSLIVSGLISFIVALVAAAVARAR